MNEIWKDIKGFEGRYQISNLGRVKSFVRYKEGRILKPGYTHPNPQQYMYVGLCIAGGKADMKNYYIHRLVAEYFCDNPNNYNEVNHIDGNTFNNISDNLEWCTHQQNMEHAKKIGVLYSHKKGADNPNSKPVNQYTKDGIFVKRWNSVNEIMRETGFLASNIFTVCNPKGKQHTSHGYIWRYADG